MATIKFSNGQSVKFNGTPTQSDIEYVAKQLGITQSNTASPGQFDVAQKPEEINHQAKLAQLQQTVPQQTARADAQGSILGQVTGTGKELWNTVTSSEQALGKTIGNTMATDEATKLANETSQSNAQMGIMFLRHIKENQSLGKDTTQLKQAYNKWRQSQSDNLQLPELPTNEQAAGQLAGVALDLLTSGSYGKGTVGMESGKLANQGFVSGLVAKTGIPSTPFKKTLPAIVQGVSDVATKPAGLFTKEGLSSVAKGSSIGYGYDVSQGLQGNRGEDRTGTGAFIPGMNTLIAGGLPAVAGFAQSVKNVASPSFNDNLNKALPVLKKDVKTLATKQKDAYTAFSDIVANKDGLIVDEAGNVKNPKDYTFNDTVLAQGKRLKSIYAEYSNKLKGVDQTKFEDSIYTGIFDQLQKTTDELKKTNSLDSRRALTKIIKELGSLQDLSPEGIQKYIEDIGQKTRTGPGQAPTLEQIKYANLGGELRKILDSSVEKIDGTGYQDLRNVYKAHKTIESQLLQAAKSELNKTPGWTDRLSNLGMTAEGINFLLTHDPHSLAIAGGIKGSTAYLKWLRSPQRALSNMFGEIEKTQSMMPRPLSPDAMKYNAMTEPIKTNISPNGTTETYLGQGIREGKQIGKGITDYARNPRLGLSMEDITKNLDATDIKVMGDFARDVKTGYVSPELALKAQKIAEAMNLNEVTATNKTLAKKFGEILDARKANPTRAVPITVREAEPNASLIQKAKKYKTAEEFVKAQGDTFYHGTGEGVSFDKFDPSKAQGGNRGKQIYLTESKVAGDWFSRLKSQGNYMMTEAFRNGIGTGAIGDFKPNTLEFIVPKDAKIKVLDKLPQYSADKIIEQLKKEGYDGVRFTDDVLNDIEGQIGLEKAFVNGKHPDTIIMFDPKKVMSKSQLTDIWKQAHPEAKFSPQVQRILNMNK